MNEFAAIEEVVGPAQSVHRLEEIGLRPGTKLCMISPGEPCLVGIGSQRFSLRLEAGVTILVQPLPQS